jgi:hypothetical protein
MSTSTNVDLKNYRMRNVDKKNIDIKNVKISIIIQNSVSVDVARVEWCGEGVCVR